MSYRTFHLPHCNAIGDRVLMGSEIPSCQQYIWLRGVKQSCKLMQGHLGSCMHTDPFSERVLAATDHIGRGTR
jgi:hypothetical protein